MATAKELLNIISSSFVYNNIYAKRTTITTVPSVDEDTRLIYFNNISKAKDHLITYSIGYLTNHFFLYITTGGANGTKSLATFFIPRARVTAV